MWNNRATGGVALLINSAHLFSKIRLHTPLQAVAARVTLNKVITFCGMYLPISNHIAKTELINLIKQLPSPFVLLGNFKGHSAVWGNESNSRGQMVKNLFSKMDLCILNDSSATYIYPTTDSTFALDLCNFFAPSQVLDYKWKVIIIICSIYKAQNLACRDYSKHMHVRTCAHTHTHTGWSVWKWPFSCNTDQHCWRGCCT